MRSCAQQYTPGNCSVVFTCSAKEGIRRAYPLWQPILPPTCDPAVAASTPWLCYFGYHVTPTRTPMFIFQFMFDGAQLIFDNAFNYPFSPQELVYVENVGIELVQKAVVQPAVMVPACVSHTIITAKAWNTIKVNGQSLSDAIHAWMGGASPRLIDKCLTPQCNKLCPPV